MQLFHFWGKRLQQSHHSAPISNLSRYSDVIMSTMAFQITSLTIVYTNVHSGADQRKYQSIASLAFVRGIHRWPVNYPHKGPVTRKMFPFDDAIISYRSWIFPPASHITIHNVQTALMNKVRNLGDHDIFWLWKISVNLKCLYITAKLFQTVFKFQYEEWFCCLVRMSLTKILM